MDAWLRHARPVAYGLLGLKPWEFVRYTVREFEEAVVGASFRYGHAVDLVMRHALVTGQWTTRVTFEDLTGRAEPLPLDPRGRRAPEDVEAPDEAMDEGRAMRAWMAQAEAQIRAAGGIRIDE